MKGKRKGKWVTAYHVRNDGGTKHHAKIP